MVSRQQYIEAFNELIKRGWSVLEAQQELKTAITHHGNYMMHDKDGNPVIDFSNNTHKQDDGELIKEFKQELDDEFDERLEEFLHNDKEEGEFDLSEDDLNMEEEGELWEPDKAPPWTIVRGSGTSFYHICPRCGAMIPGTGPKLKGPDGKERTPKEQHEDWHKSRLIDWYNEDE